MIETDWPYEHVLIPYVLALAYVGNARLDAHPFVVKVVLSRRYLTACLHGAAYSQVMLPQIFASCAEVPDCLLSKASSRLLNICVCSVAQDCTPVMSRSLSSLQSV